VFLKSCEDSLRRRGQGFDVTLPTSLLFGNGPKLSGRLRELLWAVGYTVLEIIPLSLCRASFATRTLRRVGAKREGTTGLGKFHTVRPCQF
jgi:hypothetical protein